jgi:hypothetical protein
MCRENRQAANGNVIGEEILARGHEDRSGRSLVSVIFR